MDFYVESDYVSGPVVGFGEGLALLVRYSERGLRATLYAQGHLPLAWTDRESTHRIVIADH